MPIVVNIIKESSNILPTISSVPGDHVSNESAELISKISDHICSAKFSEFISEGTNEIIWHFPECCVDIEDMEMFCTALEIANKSGVPIVVHTASLALIDRLNQFH